ncbi:MAG: LuxR C-terminal-related transcriptional regulator [Marinobacter sp.]|nr:LuxR C-terminal-related transcriptional regulator [Marinobacter sp.]
MSRFEESLAANDELLLQESTAPSGELFWELLRRRVRTPQEVADCIDRPRLAQLISQHLKPGHVLFVEAPAGYGKTQAMLASLRGRQADAVRWLTLSERDNHSARFCGLLTMALSPTGDEPASIPLVSPGDLLSLLLGRFDRQWRGGSDSPCVLVLDGIQHVTEPAVVSLLEQLANELPSTLTLALISRQPLPFAAHGILLTSRFNELNASELAFNREESSALFRDELQDKRLTAGVVEHLHSLAEGWPAPLALYLRSMRERQSMTALSDTASVARFIQEGLLTGLSEHQRDALNLMAELEICCDELFSVVCDDPAISSFGPGKARNLGLPLFPVSGKGRWYRFNGLVREYLTATSLPGAEQRALRASEWFESNGDHSEALTYALRSGDSQRAVVIASEGSESLLVSQDTASLLAWRQTLPQTLVQQSPLLRLVYGWVHAVGGQFTEAGKLLASLTDHERQVLCGRDAALQAFIHRGAGDLQQAMASADRALQDASLTPHARFLTLLVRSSALCALGHFAEARDANREAFRLARVIGDGGFEMLAAYDHARIELGKGNLGRAETILRNSLYAAASEPRRPPRIAESRLRLSLAMVLWHQGRTQEAQTYLLQSATAAEQSRDLAYLLNLALQTLIARAEGRLDDAFVCIGRAERTMQRWQVDESIYGPVLNALKASCWLQVGQLDNARTAMASLTDVRAQRRIPELFPMLPGLLDTLQIRLDIRQGAAAEAQTGLQTLQQQTEVPGAPVNGLAIYASLLAGLVAHACGEDGAALLARGITLASQERYLSPFLELRDELTPLMPEVIAGQPDNEFTRRLKELFGGCLSTPTRVVELPDPISDREQGVLELIAQGLSNQDIADRLHISLHTVKTHARRINAKLDVKSRTQAIVRAKELGLLDY